MKDPIPEDLYKILACPLCKSEVKYYNNKKSLICNKCKKIYNIRNGIPVLLP